MKKYSKILPGPTFILPLQVLHLTPESLRYIYGNVA